MLSPFELYNFDRCIYTPLWQFEIFSRPPRFSHKMKWKITDKKGALIPLTSSSLTPPYAERISRCPATSRAHFRWENCSPKLCLFSGIDRPVGHSILKRTRDRRAAIQEIRSTGKFSARYQSYVRDHAKKKKEIRRRPFASGFSAAAVFYACS